MKRGLSWMAVLALGACSSNAGSLPCVTENDCLAGFVCSDSGSCTAVAAGSLAVNITPISIVLGPGGMQKLEANRSVTWSVQEANGGTMSADGMYTAPDAEGSYHVIAASFADPSSTGTASVQVLLKPTFSLAPVVTAGFTYPLAIANAGGPSVSYAWSANGATLSATSGAAVTLQPGSVGSGSVTCVATSGGQSASTTASFTAVAPPVDPGLVAPQVISPGQVVKLSAGNVVPGLKYAWTLASGGSTKSSTGATSIVVSADQFSTRLSGSLFAINAAGDKAGGPFQIPIAIPAARPTVSVTDYVFAGATGSASITTPLQPSQPQYALTYAWTITGGSFVPSGATTATGPSVQFALSWPTGSLSATYTNSAGQTSAPTTVALRSGANGMMLAAGAPGGSGFADGQGSAARLGGGAYYAVSQQLAADGQGGAWLTDSLTVRHVSADGTVATIAGSINQSSSVDGPAASASFSYPSAIAAGDADTVFVAEDQHVRLLKRSAGAWQVSTIFTLAALDTAAIAAAGPATVFITNRDTHAIRQLSLSGSTWSATDVAGGIPGSADGVGSAAQFQFIQSMAAPAADTLLVYDGSLRRVTRQADGQWLATTVIPPSVFLTVGISQLAAVDANTAYAVISSGVGDLRPGLIRLALDGANWTATTALASTFMNLGGAFGATKDGPEGYASFYAEGLALVAPDTLLGIDGIAIRAFSIGATHSVSTLAGAADFSGVADAPAGPGTSALLSSVGSIAPAGTGTFLFQGTPYQPFRILTRTPTGFAVQTPTVASAPGCANPSSGGLAPLDASHVLYTACNALYLASATGPGAWQPSVVLGAEPGFADGDSTTARFRYPGTIAMVSPTTGFLLDRGNYVIRTLTNYGAWRAGTVTPRNIQPSALAAVDVRTLFVGSFNEIWKVTDTGAGWTWTSIAGDDTQPGGYVDGTGSTARFISPTGMVAYDANTVYVSDTFNGAVRKIAFNGSTWQVSTLVGTPGRLIDSTGPFPASLSFPTGLAADGQGGFLVADSKSSAIFRIQP